MISPDSHLVFREACDRAQQLALITHVLPDGDALGSQLGLASFLAERGKLVRIINQDPVPEALRFLSQDSTGPAIELYDPASHDAVLSGSDLVILVDNSAPDRLGRLESVMRRAAARTLCIDHHPSRGTPWAWHILDEASCATAVMIYDLIRATGFRPDRRTAEAIYTGIATDTGFFRFGSTNPHAHEVAAELLRLGVDPARVYRSVYERNSLAFTRLLGHALSGVRLLAGGTIAVVELDQALIEDLGAQDVDTSEISTSLLALEGVGVTLLFREVPEGRVKVSLRSKGGLDVHLLAAEFGGGGHRNASGIVIQGQLDAVVQEVTARAEARLSGK